MHKQIHCDKKQELCISRTIKAQLDKYDLHYFAKVCLKICLIFVYNPS